jgi:hypothetical protein
MNSTDKPTHHDQHQLLISVAEEIQVDWPRFFDWKPVVTVKEVSLAVSLVGALVGFAILCWEALGYVLNTISFLALK